jgi:hypothetical protein
MAVPDSEKAPPKLPAPESLEAKLKLLALLPYDQRARRRHCLVFGSILNWFHSKYGDALANVRHVVDKMQERRHLLPDGKGLSRTLTHQALDDLVARNFLTKTKSKPLYSVQQQQLRPACSYRTISTGPSLDLDDPRIIAGVNENGDSWCSDGVKSDADSCKRADARVVGLPSIQLPSGGFRCGRFV